MSGFIYMEADNKNDPVIGKYEFPIKAIIESESNAIEKQFSLTKALFNIERSRQFAETVGADPVIICNQYMSSHGILLCVSGICRIVINILRRHYRIPCLFHFRTVLYPSF